MDESKTGSVAAMAHAGLQAALGPDCGGGVYGSVGRGGKIRVGDTISVLE